MQSTLKAGKSMCDTTGIAAVCVAAVEAQLLATCAALNAGHASCSAACFICLFLTL
jgi:hypothetical protein